MTSEDNAKFREEFGPRVTALLNRLLKTARVGKGLMSQGDLDVLAAAAMELLTMVLANMPEPIRGERVKGLSATLAANVAQKRERLEQKIPDRRLDALRQTPPKGSA
jgi:hypothetical protein